MRLRISGSQAMVVVSAAITASVVGMAVQRAQITHEDRFATAFVVSLEQWPRLAHRALCTNKVSSCSGGGLDRVDTCLLVVALGQTGVGKQFNQRIGCLRVHRLRAWARAARQPR